MTADELALLRGVEAAPDDDLPRLVYADWLDEHGRHARAEFIRVQCELASIERRLPGMTVEERRIEGPRRGVLLHLQKLMLRTDPIKSIGLPEIDWEDDLSDWWEWGNLFVNSCKRGFVDRIRLGDRTRLGGNTLDMATVLNICTRIVPCPKVALSLLACVPSLGLPALDLPSPTIQNILNEISLNYIDLMEHILLPHELIPLMHGPYPVLDHFAAIRSRLNPGHVCVIAERLQAPKLTSIVLSLNEIVDSGVAFLHRAIYAKTLRVIDLSHNPICRPEISKLTNDRFPSLKHINLRGCPVMPESLAQLRAQLPGVEVIC